VANSREAAAKALDVLIGLMENPPQGPSGAMKLEAAREILKFRAAVSPMEP
jgi:hypothetical protein